MTRWHWIGAIVIAASLGCVDRADKTQDFPQEQEVMGGMMVAEEAPARGTQMLRAASAPGQAPAAPVTDERKIIRHGSSSIPWAFSATRRGSRTPIA